MMGIYIFYLATIYRYDVVNKSKLYKSIYRVSKGIASAIMTITQRIEIIREINSALLQKSVSAVMQC